MQLENLKSTLSAIFWLIPLTILISGCDTVRELDLFSRPVEKTPLKLESPEPVQLKKIEWIVITEENYEEVFTSLKQKNKDVVLFGLTDDEYEKLALNFAEIRKYIILNNNVLQNYRDYYEGSDDRISK